VKARVVFAVAVVRSTRPVTLPTVFSVKSSLRPPVAASLTLSMP
jgi:hypothetical protein